MMNTFRALPDYLRGLLGADHAVSRYLIGCLMMKNPPEKTERGRPESTRHIVLKISA
jgi:hypothetical protein